MECAFIFRMFLFMKYRVQVIESHLTLKPLAFMKLFDSRNWKNFTSFL